MPLHLIKLCVGCDSVEDLEEWVAEKLEEKRRAGVAVEHFHTTRMVPKRVNDLLDGGSLFWIIKGGVQCRQRLVDVRPFTDAEGIGRCRLILDPVVTRTEWQPRRPGDLAGAGTAEEMPLHLRRELAALGLL
jgi:hypothetical protein